MSDKLQTEQMLSSRILSALNAMANDGTIDPQAVPQTIDIETPAKEENGDFSTNTALKIAKAAKMAPRALAEALLERLDLGGLHVDKVQIAGAGFINFYMDNASLFEELSIILQKGDDYGRVSVEDPKRILVEYVSANPTGPMHVGNARGGAVGDGIASLYDMAGWQADREFYLNDAGNQIAKFAESLERRYEMMTDETVTMGEDLYQGADITELAEAYSAEHPEAQDMAVEDRKIALAKYGLEVNVARLKEDLTAYGIHYDRWFAESSLYQDGKVDEIVALLRENGALAERDGATWFRATDYGCEKDEVLIRSNGVPTYMASDIAYHYDKLVTRGYDLAVNVWGADHYGHVQRMLMAMKACGVDENKLKVVIIQHVRMQSSEGVVRISKRSGQSITLSDLVDAVGTDATRFLFNASSPSVHMDFNLAKAIEQNMENPVFYVQYAHARMRSIQRNVPMPEGIRPDYTLLDEKSEIALLKKLSAFSSEIAKAAEEFDPSHMTKYAIDLATLFHSFYNAVRVKSDDKSLTASRLGLVGACATVLKNTLRILGVNAPDSM